MDTYAQRFGSFSADQERRLEDLRRTCADLLTAPAPPAHAAAEDPSLRTASLGTRNRVSVQRGPSDAIPRPLALATWGLDAKPDRTRNY